MDRKIYLHNAMVVSEDTIFPGGVVIQNGKIKHLIFGDTQIEADEKINLNGNVLMPGVVDEHSHWSEPGRDWEGYITGSMAAAAGGVTTALDMPLNDLPPTISRRNVIKKKELTANKSIIDYGFWGGLIDDNLDELTGMHQEGVIGFKAFTTTASDFGRATDAILYSGLHQMKALGSLVGLHAENESVNNFLKQKMIADGRKDRNVWPESRPPEAELDAIQRAAFWSGITGGRLHILHISIADGVRAVNHARSQGAPVSAEVCAHYLFFDNNDFLKIGPELRCAPPLRSREEVERLWALVLAGEVDAIGSDHSPCPAELQSRGFTNIWDAFGGVTGIQLLLPTMITEGHHKRGLSWPQLVRLLSTNPARIFGLYPKKGSILPGADADLTVVDPNVEWTLNSSDLFSRHKHSAYVGRTFRGQVVRTFVRGETVFLDGKIVGKPGYGCLLKSVNHGE